MIHRMKFTQLLQKQLPRRDNWIGLLLMAYAAAIVAAYIHSLLVFHRGTRLYQAEIGGFYFNSIELLHNDSSFVKNYLWRFFLGNGVIAFPSFLVLLLFRRTRVLYRWMVLIIIIAVWTCVFFPTAYIDFAKDREEFNRVLRYNLIKMRKNSPNSFSPPTNPHKTPATNS